MTSNTRVPVAEITGLKGALMKRMATKMMGQVPTPLGVYWHNPKVLNASLGIGNKVQKWDACDKSLKSFAHMAVASLIGCTWCLDLNYFQAHNENLDLEKAREVPRWRESNVFTALERDVLAYAEAMSQTPPTVTAEMSARLLDRLGVPALVELTAVIAFANLTTRATWRSASSRTASRKPASWNHWPSRRHDRELRRPHDRRPVRHPPQPALHRRLRDARLRSRRGGRGAGGMAAVARGVRDAVRRDRRATTSLPGDPGWRSTAPSSTMSSSGSSPHSPRGTCKDCSMCSRRTWR